jgi:hypothetical protein
VCSCSEGVSFRSRNYVRVEAVLASTGAAESALEFAALDIPR